jgi:membrane fusion protein (multidrug efflux system)
MPSHFPHTRRTLAGKGSRPSLIAFVIILTVLALWTTWFAAARVVVYATTSTARVEVDREKHPVDAPVGGRVVAVRFAVGEMVRAGDVLLELDATPELLAHQQEEARLAPAGAQLSSLSDEIVAHERALADDERSGVAAVAEADAVTRQMAAAATFAAEEAARVSTLQRKGLISELEALRAANVATERADQGRAAEFAAQRLRREIDTRQQDRRGQIANLKGQVAGVDGTRTDAVAAAARLQYSIDQRTLRAPIDGTVAEISALKVGSMVTPGQRIATIVPSGGLKVVGLFRPAEALGRIRAGQVARIRLDAFPWTEYGNVAARVASVAGEPTDGQIRVEFALAAGHNPGIVFQHGLAAAVDVEVDRASPAALVLRSVGSHLRMTAAQP